MATKQRELTRKQQIERRVKNINAHLVMLRREEKKTRDAWNRGYQKFLQAAVRSAALNAKIRSGKTMGARDSTHSQTWEDTISKWPERTIELTKDRDACREQIRIAEQELVVLQKELAIIAAEELAQARADDSVIDQIFSLNEAVVEATRRRDIYLREKLFDDLIDKEGNLIKKPPLTHSNGRRRVVAMINTVDAIDPELAERARTEIDRFFAPQGEVDIPAELQELHKLTKTLLYQKVSYKVGPDLHRFLGMKLDPETFPALVEAQNLLMQCMRSEKTAPFARLYERKSPAHNWEPVPQS